MHKTSFAFLFLSLILTKAWAMSPTGDMPSDPESEKTAILRGVLLDPLGNTNPTIPPPTQTFEGKEYKTITLEGGLQLHPSCAAEAARNVLKPGELKKNMESNMQKMFDRLLKCREQYPELNGTLNEVISNFRRRIIKCEAPTGMKGMFEHKKVEKDKDYAAFYEYETKSIMLSNRTFGALSSFSESNNSIETVFHELLHATSCNNRHDHNEIERKKADSVSEGTSCDENTTMDRVSVVTSLCMGGQLNSSVYPASVELASRMNLCGDKRGCVDAFTEKGNSYKKVYEDGKYLASADMDEADATRLCQRIKDDGMCLRARDLDAKKMNATNKHLIRVKNLMKKRLDKILPKLSNEIPAEALNFYPNLKKKFDGLSTSPCYKNHFHKSEDNSISSIRTEVTPITWKDSGMLYTGHFDKITKDVEKFFKKFKPSEECADFEKETLEILQDLSKRMVKSQSLFYMPLLLKDEYINIDEFRDEKSDLVKMVGKDLMKEYMTVMEKNHAESPGYDCEANGMAPFRTMEKSGKLPNPYCE